MEPCRRGELERLAVMYVGQFQMAEAAGAKIIDAMHAPIRTATARLADAAPIRDPQTASRPTRARRSVRAASSFATIAARKSQD